MGNWIGLPGHVQISVIADVIIHNLQWLVVGDSEMNKTTLPSMSMTAKFVVMEDLPCIPYGDQSIPVRIAFFLYDICNMLHRIVQPLQRATLLQTAAEPSAMANRPSVLNF